MKGVYCLLISFPSNKILEIGALGQLNFEKGFCCYVGSALNSLEARIRRHLRRKKKLRWHIDWLLQEAKPKEVIFAETSRSDECSIAAKLSATFSFIKGFGCSDCRCKSHLFLCTTLKKLRNRVWKAFEKTRLKPHRRACELPLAIARGFLRVLGR